MCTLCVCVSVCVCVRVCVYILCQREGRERVVRKIEGMGFDGKSGITLKQSALCNRQSSLSECMICLACLLQNRCAFLQKTGNRKIFLFNPRNFLRAIFPFSQNALETLYCSVILTASSGQFFIYF